MALCIRQGDCLQAPHYDPYLLCRYYQVKFGNGIEAGLGSTLWLGNLAVPSGSSNDDAGLI